MIYPTVKLEEWIKEHKLKIQEFKCPKCGKDFTTSIPVISKEYVGLASPIHDCGQAFIKLVLKPTDVAKIQFWSELIQVEE